MLTGNLNLTENIEAQRAVWLILPLFVIFIIFFIGSIAETNRAPFDLAEAKVTDLLAESLSLKPYWITGFTDAEGCFTVKIFKDAKAKLGWRVQLVFQIKLNARDFVILLRIKNYFNVGHVRRVNDNIISYTVTNLKDLVKVIIPHFDNYPLLTQKWADYQLFKSITLLVLAKEHFTHEGFLKILGLRYYLNQGISEELILNFKNIVPVVRPIVPVIDIIEDWLIGFVDGEGCFYINIVKSEKGYKVWLLFQITQHIRDTELFERIAFYFNCGSVKIRGKDLDAVDFELTKFENINNIIIPFFNLNSLQSSKSEDFKLFCEAAHIINSKQTRSWDIEDINILSAIKEKMNKYVY